MSFLYKCCEAIAFLLHDPVYDYIETTCLEDLAYYIKNEDVVRALPPYQRLCTFRSDKKLKQKTRKLVKTPRYAHIAGLVDRCFQGDMSLDTEEGLQHFITRNKHYAC